MKIRGGTVIFLAGVWLSGLSQFSAAHAQVRADFSLNKAKNQVRVRQDGTQLRATWPMAKGEYGVLSLELRPNLPLIREMGVAPSPNGKAVSLLQNVEPVTVLTVGTRDLSNPAGWVAFFDDPPKRPHQSYRATLAKSSARIESIGQQSTIIIGGLSAGPFSGDLRFTLYPGTRLIHVQAVVSTARDASAILYDAGLSSATPSWNSISYLDNKDQWQRGTSDENATPVAVRYRTIMAQSAGGTVAVFPPPHAYFYPLDFADNFKFVWHGRGFHNLVSESGFGIRQPPEGDGRHVPWVNAPPGTQQKLGVFYLLSRGKPEEALAEVKRYTHDDRFPHLNGYQTFSSHYHVEHTLDFLDAQKKQNTTGVPRGMENPGFVQTFKARGVDIVHLAEFHIGWSDELRAKRLEMQRTLHEECARLSDSRFLLLPGEEPNEHLGGHWLSFFPKPVYWTLTRGREQPFSEQVAGYGTVYHVGNAADVLRLMNAENGLVWTAHPRIKGSIGFPDRYKNTDFFLSNRFLGGAWKAMPSDLSKPQLGTRVLDLEDDMANWGLRKYIPGEVDVFKINTESELYAHMNINYLKLKQIPRFQDGWGSVLDALRNGQFFVTTGEVLLPSFSIDGKESGQVLKVTKNRSQVKAALQWTFPLRFAEIVSGDGTQVFRQKVDLSDTRAFGQRTLSVNTDLSKRLWARLEVWDVAGNGAFTQPVWIESSALPPRAAPSVSVPKPATFARFVPERSDDFAWENDLVAFRTFGPALRAGIENSGIDCWLKRVPYPIIDKWYAGEKQGIPYSVDSGEGYDAYAVGSSRGCGGDGIWKNGQLYLADTFKSWKVVSQTPQKTVFELAYDYDVEGETIHEDKRITLELGQRLFRSESTFTQNGQPISVDVGIGVTTHGGKATATLNPQQGWMACWESIDGSGLGTGVAIEPQKVREMREVKSDDANLAHALLITRTDVDGRVSWFSGYGWERAGAITTSQQWNSFLARFAGSIRP